MEFVANFITNNSDDENILENWMTDEENSKEIEKIIKTAKKTSTKNSTEKKVKDPNKPKRGKSSYLFFCADNREKVKEDLEQKGEDFKATDVTKELGKRWAILKDSTKKSAIEKVKKYTTRRRRRKI